MNRGASLILVAIALHGCSGKKPAPARVAGDAAPPIASVDAAAPARMATLVPRAEVDAFLARWLDAQNKGDFAAYGTLYADEFRGVRRSGKQTVRMDRTKWLAERKRMFAKPMKVAADEVRIMVSPRGAIVRFTQDWASGTYHDTGPKQLVLESQSAGLVLIGEEMLASNLVKPPPAGAWSILPVYKGRIVLTDEIAAGLGDGKPTLEAGEVRKRDPGLNCDDTPDYEHEQDRYWACHNSDPANASDRFVAREGVVKQAIAPAHAAWIGRSVSLGGGAGPCTGTITGLELYGEREATYETVTAGGSGKKAIAAAVLAGSPVLVAIVDGGCDAAWAVSADAPAPVAWTTSPAPPDVAKQALTGLEAVDGYADLMEDPYGKAPQVTATVIENGPRKLVLAARTGYRSCQETGGVAALFELPAGGAPTLVFATSDPVELRDAVDADADGWPELVLADGLIVHAADEWDRWRPIDFPDEVGECYCECE